MSPKFNSEEAFLKIGFRSPEREGSLRTIELFGVPGEKLSNGEYAVSEKTQRFFDDLMVRKIFRKSHRLPDCKFEYLKIWLYDMNVRDEERGYEIPEIDKYDLEICSKFSSSSLERIYILDNELTGREYELWKKNSEDLFTLLFHQFTTLPEAPEPPDIIRNIPFLKHFTEGIENLTEDIAEKAAPYLKMKQSIFFNALIIQID